MCPVIRSSKKWRSCCFRGWGDRVQAGVAPPAGRRRSEIPLEEKRGGAWIRVTSFDLRKQVSRALDVIANELGPSRAG
jgi:hypothetical protein